MATAAKASNKAKTNEADQKPQEAKIDTPKQLFDMSVDTFLGSFQMTHDAASKLKDAQEPIRRFMVKSTSPVDKRYPIRIGMEVVYGGFAENNFGIWNVPAALMDQLSRHDINRHGKIQIVDFEY